MAVMIDHRFTLPPLASHFQAHPPLKSALELLAMPSDHFVETRDHVDVLGGALWKLSVMWDEEMGERLVKQHDASLDKDKAPKVDKEESHKDGKDKRDQTKPAADLKKGDKGDEGTKHPMEKNGRTTRDHVVEWLIRNRGHVVDALLAKIEPPLSSFHANKCFDEVGGMMEELLLKTIPLEEKGVDAKDPKGKDDDEPVKEDKGE